MELHTLKPAKGAVKKTKRIGRGQGSGKGGTSTRGHKGAASRSGYKHRWGFEGGQTPIQRRTPKRGFKNINRIAYTPVNLDDIQYLSETYKLNKIDLKALRELGMISRTELVKILGRGELNAKVDVEVHKISAKAKEAIEAAGGSVTLIEN
jgi:large subunit ribosomal protein L15